MLSTRGNVSKGWRKLYESYSFYHRNSKWTHRKLGLYIILSVLFQRHDCPSRAVLGLFVSGALAPTLNMAAPWLWSSEIAMLRTRGYYIDYPFFCGVDQTYQTDSNSTSAFSNDCGIFLWIIVHMKLGLVSYNDDQGRNQPLSKQFLQNQANRGTSTIGFCCWISTPTRWWFQRFFIFIPTWGRFPFWLIFFRWVETTS